MKTRCSLPSVERFPNYGGRGVGVCERWESSFENFLADVGPRPSINHSLDRIDVNGNYEPGNVRWATRAEQMRNMTTNHWEEYNGERRILSDWAVIFKTSPSNINSKLKKMSFAAIVEYFKNKNK